MTSTSNEIPTRGKDAVEILKNDHTTIKSLLDALVDATQTQKRRSILDQLKAILTIHNATEENLVYPALEKIGRQKRESQHLYKETGEADVLVFELDTMLQTGEDEEFAPNAEKLRDAVYEHIEDEETTAFPELTEKATPEESKRLTGAVKEFRGSFRFEPPSAKTA